MITLLLTTRNNPGVLNRHLSFLANQGFKYPIIVLDGSSPEKQGETNRVLSQFGQAFQLQVIRDDPDMQKGKIERRNTGVIPAVARGAKEAQTPYVIWAQDDDFIVEKDFTPYIEFMEKHPEYSTINGMGLAFIAEQEKIRDFIRSQPDLSKVDVTQAPIQSSTHPHCQHVEDDPFRKDETPFGVLSLLDVRNDETGGDHRSVF